MAYRAGGSEVVATSTSGSGSARREPHTPGGGLYMQMVGVYCEKRAPYEYVKWETKQKIKREKRRREMCTIAGFSGTWEENGPVRGKAEITAEVSIHQLMTFCRGMA